MPSIKDSMLTPAQAGELAQVTHWTIRRWISNGSLKAYRVPGSRTIRIRQSDLEKALKPITSAAENLGGDAA